MTSTLSREAEAKARVQRTSLVERLQEAAKTAWAWVSGTPAEENTSPRLLSPKFFPVVPPSDVGPAVASPELFGFFQGPFSLPSFKASQL